jgi:hypothetical protein
LPSEFHGPVNGNAKIEVIVGILEEKSAILPPPPLMTKGGSSVKFIENMIFG